MKKKDYVMYESPNLEVVEVEVEKGFNLSNGQESYTPVEGEWD